MIRAFSKTLAVVLCAALSATPLTARATLMADPVALYDQMKAAYDKGAAHDWTFFDQEYYLSTIFDAGRAYSLQHPDAPAYAELAHLTVVIGSSLNYDPLIDHDAVPWYVDEAAHYVALHDPDSSAVPQAVRMISRLAAVGDPQKLAQYADEDASANLQRYPRDAFALLQRVEANWRGFLLTGDAAWRSLALQRADDVRFPVADFPATWGPGFVNALKNAVHRSSGYSSADAFHATAVLKRLRKVNPLLVIANVTSRSHEANLESLAPADEYFGPMGMSILGIRNELYRVNYLIDHGYADRESAQAIQVAVAIDDLHKVYPRDRDLPQMLLEIYDTLGKINTADARAAREHVRAILTIEYQDSPQAQRLLL